jgi:nucleoside 2-deoxyribosyltransferase
MSKPLVYLAGPISNCSYNECTDWREYAVGNLRDSGIMGISPMRSKEYLANHNKIQVHCKSDHKYSEMLSSPKAITTRDRWDCTRADAVLVNLIGSKTVSIGTVMEIAWADASRTPIIAIMEDGNIHNHPMIKECIGFTVTSIDDALYIIKSLLL